MRRTWGSLVATEITMLAPLLAIGCGAAPPPEPVAAPPEPPPPPVVFAPVKKTPDLSDPPDAKPGLGAFVPLVPVSAATEVVLPADPGQIVAFGKGVMQHVSLATPPGFGAGCLIADHPGGCTFLRFAPWKKARDRAQWDHVAHENDVGAWSAFMPAGDWGNLSPGKDVVYALRREGTLAIDTVDEKGKITSIFDGANAPPLFDVRLVETATGLLAIGTDGDTQSLASVALKRKDGGSFGVGPSKPLKIVMTGDEGSAQQARWIMDNKQRAGYGTWDVLPGIDEKGNPDKVVYMAWTEASPPAKYAPRGVVKKGGHGGAKHGCGGRPSRPLFDVSVEKKTHLTVLGDDGHIVGDHVIPIEAPTDAPPNLGLVAVPGGVEVNGVPFSKDGKPKGAAKPKSPEPPMTPPPVLGPVLQKLESAQFDPKSGEGIVVYSEKDDQRAVRFDARGNPIGGSIDITNRLQAEQKGRFSLARAGDSWVALEPAGDAVVVVDGMSAGKRIAIASDRSWVLPKSPAWVLPADDTHVTVVRFVPLPKTYLLEIGVGDPSLSRGLMLSTVDVENGTSTPWSLANGWFSGETVTPRLTDISFVARAQDGGLMLVGHGSKGDGGTMRLIRRNPDGSWAAPTLLGEGSDVRWVAPHRVWGDVVALLGGSHAVATWLESGKTLPVDGNPGREARGPLVGTGGFALPSTPAALVALPAEVAKLAGSCPIAYPTGPSRVVMICDEPVDPTRPSARVGLRTIRY
jgi:hypothetical protein